jgi:glucosamine-6-phosphate deaminase
LNIIKVKNYQEMTDELTDIFVSQIHKKPDSILSFTTGATPKGLLEALAKRIQEGLDVTDCVFCNLDEYVCSKSMDCSVYHFMNYHLYDRIDKKPKEILMFDAEADDQEKELTRYKALMDQYPRDIQLLGLGANGHIGANEPGTPFESAMFVADSEESTIAATRKLFDMSDEEVPTQMYTMGFKEIMEAHCVVLAASGTSKAQAVKMLVEGPVTPSVPASRLKQHSNFILIIDEEAASLL